MADLSQFFFKITLDTIEESYRAGRDALTSRIEQTSEEASRYALQLKTGQVIDEIVDEDTGYTFSQSEAFAYQEKLNQEILNIHAQAFAVMIHHAWEKHVLNLNPDWARYCCHKAYGELTKLGWAIDKPRLERLRMVSNFVKHEGTEILDYHAEMFDGKTVFQFGDRMIFDDDALIVSEDDILDFLDTAYQSAGRVRL